jgi:hypothetical protein
MAWVRKNEANASTSPAARATAPAVAALAARTARRRGTAVNVVRISPVECSAVNASTPSTATASCAVGKPLKLR